MALFRSNGDDARGGLLPGGMCSKTLVESGMNRDSVGMRRRIAAGAVSMMGRRKGGQSQFFYTFELDRVVPPDHLIRQIDAVLDLSWVHKELAAYYSHTGRARALS